MEIKEIESEISAVIEINVSKLHIDKPQLLFVSAKEFSTPTTKAAATLDGSSIAINNDFFDYIVASGDKPMLWLVLSHELRHVWQGKHKEFFDNYKRSADVPLKDYNEQKAEIDAWAWAMIVMEYKFGVRPTLEKQFGDEFMRKVYNRAMEILQ